MWALIQYNWYHYKREKFGHKGTHAGRTRREDEGREERPGIESTPALSTGRRHPADTFFCLLASRTVRQQVPGVLSHPGCGFLLGQL